MPRVELFLGATAFVAALGCGDNNPRTNPIGDDRPDASNPTEVDAGIDAPTGEANLVLHYAFEDSGTQVTDSSLRAKHGTLSSVSGWTADGRVGRGVAMTGANPADVFVSLPNGTLTGVQDFTISFWVKLNTVSAWARIYDFGNGSPIGERLCTHPQWLPGGERRDGGVVLRSVANELA